MKSIMFLAVTGHSGLITTIPVFIIYFLLFLSALLFLARYFRNLFGKCRQAAAIVVDKSIYSSETLNKISGKTLPKFVAVFQAEGRLISLTIPEPIFDQINIHDKGVLKYKGNRLLGFSKGAGG